MNGIYQAFVGARTQIVRSSRRETLYKMMMKKQHRVLCFVCGQTVEKSEATLEHVRPLSRGGTDDFANLTISHRTCNSRRGNRW